MVNQLLPEYLAIGSGNNKVTERVNPRTIRHYTSLGLIDEPHKSGKYAQYNYRHLLQILLVKKLLSQGYGTTTIDCLLTAKSDRELENLLTGGVELQVNTANPALAYLEQLRSRERMGSSPPDPALLPPQTPTPLPNSSRACSSARDQSTSEWVRLEILHGLELHVRSDFCAPQSRSEENSLYRSIVDRLKAFIYK